MDSSPRELEPWESDPSRVPGHFVALLVLTLVAPAAVSMGNDYPLYQFAFLGISLVVGGGAVLLVWLYLQSKAQAGAPVGASRAPATTEAAVNPDASASDDEP